MRIGEKIYLRVAEIHAKWSSSMDFGVTNKNPSKIVFYLNERVDQLRNTEKNEPFINNYLPNLNDVICFTLNENATLSFSVNDIIHQTMSLKKVLIKDPVWLSFDLYGKTQAVEISNKKPKVTSFNSYAREYTF